MPEGLLSALIPHCSMLLAGVVLFWRGVWNTWDYLFGLGLWSELACIATGLSIMMLIRLTNVPLAQVRKHLKAWKVWRCSKEPHCASRVTHHVAHTCIAPGGVFPVVVFP